MHPAAEDPFAPALTAARRARLTAVLAAEHADAAMVIGDPRNVRYLSGFHGSNGALLVTGGQSLLFTDFRYLAAAQTQAPGIPVQRAGDCLAAALDEAPGTVLVEGHHVSAARWADLSATHPQARLAEDIVASLRSVKDAAETAVIEDACRISQVALLAVLHDGVLGRTEREIARRLEWLLGEGRGEGPAFDSIVATGPHSAIPHHEPTGRTVARGDLLKIDFGARVAGYHADITRTFVVAAEPQPWQREIHGIVAAAQTAGRDAVRDGAAIAGVDRAARSIIAGAGYGECFGHGLGHGVGLAIHERPLIAAATAGTLVAGMAITIEPGIYLPGRGGVRIEDTVDVAARGCRSLVGLSRELVTVQ